MQTSPQIQAKAVFQAQTATGKLNAEIIPIIPSGWYCSYILWPGRSECIVSPCNCLDKPTAKSQISIISWTSPRPSWRLFPISYETNLPKGSFSSLKRSPNCLTISPRCGAGIFLHVLKATLAVSITSLNSLFVVNETEPIFLPSTGEKDSIISLEEVQCEPVEVPKLCSSMFNDLRTLLILIFVFILLLFN